MAARGLDEAGSQPRRATRWWWWWLARGPGFWVSPGSGCWWWTGAISGRSRTVLVRLQSDRDRSSVRRRGGSRRGGAIRGCRCSVIGVTTRWVDGMWWPRPMSRTGASWRCAKELIGSPLATREVRGGGRGNCATWLGRLRRWLRRFGAADGSLRRAAAAVVTRLLADEHARVLARRRLGHRGPVAASNTSASVTGNT